MTLESHTLNEGSHSGWGLGIGKEEEGGKGMSLTLLGMANLSRLVARHPDEGKVGWEGTETAFTRSRGTTGYSSISMRKDPVTLDSFVMK